jgi:hypothetical protein
VTLRRFLCLTLLCLLPAFAFAEIQVNLEQELKVLERGEKLQRRIPDAKFRVAVFTYEDPDGTGLGDALAGLVGRELLLRSEISSFGVLTYEGGLAPSPSNPLSYFDKVETVANAQKVTLSIWGMVRRRGSTLTIETYVQLPTSLFEKTFVWRVKLPARMKGELVAHLRPERILAQRLELPDSAMETIRTAALRNSELRAEPADSSPVASVLPRDKVYWIEKSQGDWVNVNAGGGQSGWVRASGNCSADCAHFLDAARFGAALLAFMEQPRPGLFSGSLSADAQAVRDQLEAYDLIDRNNVNALRRTAARIDDQLRTAESAGRVPPGGAALANAWMIDSMVLLLRSEARQRPEGTNRQDIMASYQELEPDRKEIAAMAFRLADASLGDPDNADVLHNLAVLFEYAGDAKRADLARSLAKRSAR